VNRVHTFALTVQARSHNFVKGGFTPDILATVLVITVLDVNYTSITKLKPTNKYQHNIQVMS